MRQPCGCAVCRHSAASRRGGAAWPGGAPSGLRRPPAPRSEANARKTHEFRLKILTFCCFVRYIVRRSIVRCDSKAETLLSELYCAINSDVPVGRPQGRPNRFGSAALLARRCPRQPGEIPVGVCGSRVVIVVKGSIPKDKKLPQRQMGSCIQALSQRL